MSSVLNSGADVLTARTLFGGAPAENSGRSVLGEYAAFEHASVNRAPYRDVTEHEPGVGRRNYLTLGTLIVGLHLAAFWVYIHTPSTPYVLPHKSEVMVEFAKPEVIPPPVVEPPKPPPPQPKVQHEPPPPRPVQALRTPPAEQNIAADDLTVKENTEAPKSTGPVVADAPPAPPAPVAAPPAPPPPKEEPITEAFGGIGYLNNPPPEYPAVATRQGWTGKVVLRVRVLPDGSAGGVEVKKSTGHKVLDDAAINAVKGWKFSPAKRGNTPVEGGVNVTLDFQG